MFFPDHQPQRQSGIAYFPNQKIDIDRSMQFPIRRMVIITFHNSFFPSIIPRLYRKFQPGCSQRQSIDNASIYSIISYVATKNILNAPYPSRMESKSVTDACFMRHAGRRHAKDERASTKSTAQARCAQGIVTGGVTTPK